MRPLESVDFDGKMLNFATICQDGTRGPRVSGGYEDNREFGENGEYGKDLPKACHEFKEMEKGGHM